jgi:hypothetical protein
VIENYFCTVKKWLVSIIALLYLVSASGVIVDIHYCMGDLEAATEHTGDNCGACGKDKKESKWLKLKDAHQHVKLPKQIKQFSADAQLPRLVVNDTWIAAGQVYSLQYFNSPLLQENDIYLQNRVLRI